MSRNGRDANGKFVRGNACSVGNAGGAPRTSVRTAIREILSEPIEVDGRTLVQKARDVLVEALDSDNEDVQLRAAIDVLNRAFGKPAQTLRLTPANDEEIDSRLDAAEIGLLNAAVSMRDGPHRLNGHAKHEK